MKISNLMETGGTKITNYTIIIFEEFMNRRKQMRQTLKVPLRKCGTNHSFSGQRQKGRPRET